MKTKKLALSIILILIVVVPCYVMAESYSSPDVLFPPSLSSYEDSHLGSIVTILSHRISQSPFNLWASLIFLGAILHTFFAGKFSNLAHQLEHAHREKLKQKHLDKNLPKTEEEEVSFMAEVCHFLGEVEVIFGIWIIPLLFLTIAFYDWNTFVGYTGNTNYSEPMFVVVVMTLAATRPIIQLSERVLGFIAKLMGNSAAAWWLSILSIAPVLGSFITEPGAMTIAAMLLSKKFYSLKPSKKFSYATIGLLFVNISVGGTLSHFAAPPVLMVAGKWNWDLGFMFSHYGWKAIVGILIANFIYFILFRKELAGLNQNNNTNTTKADEEVEEVPFWIILVHILFMVWTVFNVHHVILFIGGFLFFLGFAQATKHHQGNISIRPALLVGFFLAGLVTHGGLQGWWIAPILGSLGEVPLMLGATILTAFNDNAAITYLSTLVPNFSEAMKYAVVAGAVTGGGLTVIANAPNPAGQSILQKHFDGGVSPLYLFLSALIPTIIMGLVFMLFR